MRGVGRWKLNFDRTPPRREGARGAAGRGVAAARDERAGAAAGKTESGDDDGDGREKRSRRRL